MLEKIKRLGMLSHLEFTQFCDNGISILNKLLIDLLIIIIATSFADLYFQNCFQRKCPLE